MLNFSSRSCLLVLVALLPFLVDAQSQDDIAREAPLEEVLVTGQQPGPGLWKVTRPDDANGHVLWILGNHSPLPKKLSWRSTEL
jgi:hypothetical protein